MSSEWTVQVMCVDSGETAKIHFGSVRSLGGFGSAMEDVFPVNGYQVKLEDPDFTFGHRSGVNRSFVHKGMPCAERAPAYVREKADTLIPLITSTVIKMMTELDAYEEAVNLNSDEAETALERLARGIGGEYIFPHLIQQFPMMFSNPICQIRHAALMAICAVGECCHEVECQKTNGQYRAVLTVFGEEEPTESVASHRGDAESNEIQTRTSILGVQKADFNWIRRIWELPPT
ncbi:hypothetical protein DAPPUDRAFT_238901 [Daphnia pulex]|uniref:Uncharacterized protein n=1 Tax=Daphnia pulex TaxID=6669 RepID=E9G7R1_DAPPU|nr:hypothetical protein DAPPUDRAFT_238901 [Daphnia pulex]|eukprot:EFX84613.1 hypothetical protein DAPPUDRAFT_238901 [Daphnia pulex]